ncbi:MAG: hypothetical protein JWQ43_1709 [Glaciihabitans sp.]|nr:hypothetical protein [Glaciihabitans sp.]
MADFGPRKIGDMSIPATISTLGGDALDPVRATVIAVVTVVVIVGAALVLGIVLLFRRRSSAGRRDSSRSGASAPSRGSFPPPSAQRPLQSLPTPELSLLAGTTLVQVDDAVEAAENELGFAIAQFGGEATRGYGAAVRQARASVAEAFRIQQQLDDAFPESDQQRRELTRRVISLGQMAQRALDEQDEAFRRLRRSEADSPARLAALRQAIAAGESALTVSRAELDRLTAKYAAHVTATVLDNPASAAALLAKATTTADEVDARLSSASPVSTGGVSGDLASAEAFLHKATAQLDAIATLGSALQQAEAALAHLAASTRADLPEARALRDNPPDPQSGAELVAAITAVDAALVSADAATRPAGPGDRDPITTLGRLSETLNRLDAALAVARNQQQRLEHAATALVGALVAARSQISVTRSFMAGARSGADARTRLAEAERQLMLAESESDPVEALDAARRSASAARDADALARYRG